MSFRWFIYYCSLCGGCAAYVGWALGRVPPVEHHVVLSALRGMFLGLALAVGLTLVDSLSMGNEGAWKGGVTCPVLAGNPKGRWRTRTRTPFHLTRPLEAIVAAYAFNCRSIEAGLRLRPLR